MNFNHKAEAIDAGYTPIRGEHLPVYCPGGKIRIQDVSPGRSQGYDFQIVAIPDHDYAELREGCPKPLNMGRSIEVGLREERNQGGGLGAVSPMFPPGVVARDVARGREFLARWYEASGDAAQDRQRVEGPEPSTRGQQRQLEWAKIRLRQAAEVLAPVQ